MEFRKIIVRMLFFYNNIIRLMQKGTDLDKRYYKNNTMLMMFSMYDMKKEAGLLIKSGANLNLRDSAGKTALHIAIRFGSYDIAEMLIKNGAGLDIPDELGRTSVHYAAMSNAKSIIELLVQYGANIDKTDMFGETALFKAISYNKYEVVDTLIENGKNLNIADNFGTTPLHLAVMIKNEGLLNKLLDKDVDMDRTNMVGQTPLTLAVRKGYTKIASRLIENGATLGVITRYGRAEIVDEACMKGYVDMVSMLIKNGANITKYSINWAVGRGEDHIIKMINILNNNQQVNVCHDEERIVKSLLQRGQSLLQIKKFAVYNNKIKRLREVSKYTKKLEDGNLVYKAVKNNNEKMANMLLRELTYDSARALEYLLNDKSLNDLLNKKIKSDTRERIKNTKMETEIDCILNCIHMSKQVSRKLEK